VNTRIAVAAGTVVALATGTVEAAHGEPVPHVVGAFLAGALAAAICWFVTTLPGVSGRGLVIGGLFVLAGMISWTSLSYARWLVWPLLAIEGVVFAVWSWPWIPELRALPRLGTAWLGVAYWLLGIVGAVLVGAWTVGAQRVAYAGVFGLAVLAVVATVRRDRGRDPSVGIVAAFLIALGVLAVSGSGNLFEHRHVVPAGGWGTEVMIHRFWGGPWLLYHPNSLALIGVLVAMRIGVDRAFALWQRIAVTVLAGAVIYITNSRTGFVYFGAAAVVHGYLLWRRRGADLPAYRRVWLAAAAPFAVLVLVLVISGGQGFLFQSRYPGGDVTSGRLDTWKRVGTDWVHGNAAQKLFGDTATARAVVVRTTDKLQLTTDNAAVGALRRGGLLGVVAFLLGLALLVRHAWPGPAPDAGGRRAPPAWFTVTAIGSIATIPTADWLLGGTGGTLWILLVAGEAWLLLRPAADRVLDEPKPAPVQS
jgi:O-Antigen ligase